MLRPTMFTLAATTIQPSWSSKRPSSFLAQGVQVGEYGGATGAVEDLPARAGVSGTPAGGRAPLRKLHRGQQGRFGLRPLSEGIKALLALSTLPDKLVHLFA